MRFIFFVSLVLLFAGFSSCKKDNDAEPSGNIIWKVQVRHHTQVVSDARVWIKSGVTAFPGQDTTLYEYGKDCDALGEVSFTELLSGDYYLYCEGNDGVNDVIGALDITLADSSFGKVVNSILPVTE